MKTSYNVFALPNTDMCSTETVDKLNLLGDDGWEFVSVSENKKLGLFKKQEPELYNDEFELEFEPTTPITTLN